MTGSQIANLAHESAARVLAGWRLSAPMSDFDGCARVACGSVGLDPDSNDGQLFTDRFVGHVINVQAGTAGL